MMEFTHMDSQGQARMVDVSGKADTVREAIAKGTIVIGKETLKRIQDHSVPKGDVFAVARIAGILAAKEVPHLVPLCHPLSVSAVEVSFFPDYEKGEIEIESRVKTVGKTGAEIEALAAVSIAALTIYDMCKAIDKGMTIGNIRLVSKKGGESGTYVRE